MKIRLLKDVVKQNNQGKILKVYYKAGEVVSAEYRPTALCGCFAVLTTPDGYNKTIELDKLEIVDLEGLNVEEAIEKYKEDQIRACENTCNRIRGLLQVKEI